MDVEREIVQEEDERHDDPQEEGLAEDCHEMTHGSLENTKSPGEGSGEAQERRRDPCRKPRDEPFENAHGAVCVNTEEEQDEQDDDGYEGGHTSRHSQSIEASVAPLSHRRRQDEDVQSEKRQDGREIEQPLENDGREPRRGRNAMAAGHEIGANELARSRNQEVRGEPPEGDQEEPAHTHLPERGEELLPSPGSDDVSEQGRNHDAEQRQKVRRDERSTERPGIDTPEEEGEERDTHEAADRQAPAVLPHLATPEAATSLESVT